MEKARKIIVNIAFIIYVILIIKKVKPPQALNIFLVGIILSNYPIEEWRAYSQTKNKIHLILPIISVIILILVFFILII